MKQKVDSWNTLRKQVEERRVLGKGRLLQVFKAKGRPDECCTYLEIAPPHEEKNSANAITLAGPQVVPYFELVHLAMIKKSLIC